MKAKCIVILSSVALASFGLGYALGRKHDPAEKKVGTDKATQLQAKKGDGGKEKPANYQRKNSPKKTRQRTAPLKPEPQPPLADEFPLRLGSEGRRVERLQVWLMRNYGHTGTINGVFDEKTQAQVKRYLKTREVNQDLYEDLELDKPIQQQALIR